MRWLLPLVVLAGGALAGCFSGSDGESGRPDHPVANIPVPVWKPGYWWLYDVDEPNATVKVTVLNVTMRDSFGAAIYVVRQEVTDANGTASRPLAVRQRDLMNLGEVVSIENCPKPVCQPTASVRRTPLSGGDALPWKAWDWQEDEEYGGRPSAEWFLSHVWPSGYSWWASSDPAVCGTGEAKKECRSYSWVGQRWFTRDELSPSGHQLEDSSTMDFGLSVAHKTIVMGGQGFMTGYEGNRTTGAFGFSWAVPDEVGGASGNFTFMLKDHGLDDAAVPLPIGVIQG